MEPVIPAAQESRDAGGRPAAGHFPLRGQAKVTKGKAAPGSPRLRVPCVTRQARRLRISLASMRRHMDDKARAQTSPRRKLLARLRYSAALKGSPRSRSGVIWD